MMKNNHLVFGGCISRRGRYTFAALLLVCASLFAMLIMYAPRAAALTTIPTKMNFQGRLTDSTGAVMPNGTYNMKFRLYDASSGGTLKWSADRLVTSSQGVTVVGGLFSVQLGEISSMPADLFATGQLYLEVELPTPASATSTSPVWSEGPMTPRNELASSAYAYNAETLDGKDSADFGQLIAANTWTGSNSFNGMDFTVQTTSGSIDLSSNGDFNATTAGSMVLSGGYVDLIGQGMSINSSANLLIHGDFVKLRATSLFSIVDDTDIVTLFQVDTVTNTVTVGSADNGFVVGPTGITYTGTARPLRTISLAPEYPGSTFTGDGTNNNGSLNSDFCSSSSLLNINPSSCPSAGDEYNYYSWTTTQVTPQDYDIYIRYRMPSDYVTGSMTNLQLTAMGTTGASESAVLDLIKASATACGTTGDAITADATWATVNTTSPLGACTINAGDMVTLRVRLTAGTNNTARAANISFNYRSKF